MLALSLMVSGKTVLPLAMLSFMDQLLKVSKTFHNHGMVVSVDLKLKSLAYCRDMKASSRMESTRVKESRLT